MMIKTKALLILIFAIASLNIHSQTYTFEVSKGQYTDLVESISLNDGMTWDDNQFIIPIGFDFQFFNSIMDEIFIEDIASGVLLTFDTSETGIFPVMLPYGADIVDRGFDTNTDIPSLGSESNISYLLEGNEGERILKIEWNNVGFYFELQDDDISSDFTNFQVWLYEGTNEIEIHFGPNSITQPLISFEDEFGTYIGLFSEYDADNDLILGETIMLFGNPCSPIPVFEPLAFLNDVIPEGTIYKFSFMTSNVEEQLRSSNVVSLYPNPASEFLQINQNIQDIKIESIIVSNIVGQTLIEVVNNKNELIDISNLKSGIYFIQIHTNLGMITKEIVKK